MEFARGRGKRMRGNEEKAKMRASFSFREERKSEMIERSTYLSVQIRDKYDDDDGERRISSSKQTTLFSLLSFFLSFFELVTEW